MNYKKSPFVISFAIFLFVFGFSAHLKAYASELVRESPPIEMAKTMIIDETRSTVFILNFDGTLSAYNFTDDKFTISRRKLGNVGNPESILISQDGLKLAFFSLNRSGRLVSIFKLSDIFAADSFLPTATYSFPRLTEGSYFGHFSANSKELYITYGENNLFILDTEKNSQDSILVGDNPIRIVSDKSGNIFTLNAKSENLSKIDISKEIVTATIKVGSNPKEILFNDVTKQIYISHVGSDDVYVVNATTGKIVKIIQIGGDPTSMAYDKANGNVFVASNSSGVLNIISPDFKVDTMQLDSTAYFNSAPFRLFYKESEKKLFVLNSSNAELLIYDTLSKKIVNKIKTDYFPVSVFGSDKLDSIFIQHSNANSIYEVSAKTYNVKRIPEQIEQNKNFFQKPQGIMGDENTNRIFVTNLGSDKIQVIDGNTLKVSATITVGRSPQSAHIQPVTKKLYAYSPSADTIAVVDIAKQDYPTKIIKVGKQPFGIASNSKTNKLYISFAGESKIGILNGANDQLVGDISLPSGSFPLVISVNENLNKIYSAAYGSDFITVIDGESDKIKKQITVGQNPIWVTYISELDRVFVTVEGDKKVVVIDPKDDKVVQEIKISAVPYRIFFDKRTNYVYINHRSESDVTILERNNSSSEFKIVKEISIPYWGETDILFNMLWLNKKTNLAYLTLGSRNNVNVIKDELDDQNIRRPVWYATINADGSATFSEAAREELKTTSKNALRLKKIYYGVSAVVIVLITGWLIWFLKKRKETISV